MRRVPLLALVVLGAVLVSLLPVGASPLDGTPVTCEAVTGNATAPQPCTVKGAVGDVGEKTFEPTMGAAPDGSLWFSTTPGSGVAVGFGASISRSTDGGATWADAGRAAIAGERVPLETNDPYIYVDPGTGRVFEFHMQPILLCATLSWSDDGGSTWETNPAGCAPTGAWDHQTMVAARPRTVATQGYPNVLHSCVNAVYAEMCSRSLDGGRTWQPAVVAWPNDRFASNRCGTQTGHLAAAPDGTLYLPTSDCGTFPTVGISRDDGQTWQRVRVADTPMEFEDPAAAVDQDGNVYVAFADQDGQLWFVVSRDAGGTWSDPVPMTSRRVTAGKIALTVGDPGRIALAAVATGSLDGQVPGKADLSTEEADAVRWGAFMTTSVDALAPAPTFQTLEVTGTDPLFNDAAACGPGLRCAYIVDFIEATVTPDGRPYGAFVDGCTARCATAVGAANNVRGNEGRGLVASVDVDLCAARCSRFAPAPAGPAASTPPVPVGTTPVGDVPAGDASPFPGMDRSTFVDLLGRATAERDEVLRTGTARPR